MTILRCVAVVLAVAIAMASAEVCTFTSSPPTVKCSSHTFELNDFHPKAKTYFDVPDLAHQHHYYVQITGDGLPPKTIDGCTTAPGTAGVKESNGTCVEIGSLNGTATANFVTDTLTLDFYSSDATQQMKLNIKCDKASVEPTFIFLPHISAVSVFDSKWASVCVATPTPTPGPTPAPTKNGTTPTAKPTMKPTPAPTKNGTTPTAKPTMKPTVKPTPAPTNGTTPTAKPTPAPTNGTTPTAKPTPAPTNSSMPTMKPTPAPTNSSMPTMKPTPAPTNGTTPTPAPTNGTAPTPAPTNSSMPTMKPTPTPTPAPKPLNRIAFISAFTNGGCQLGEPFQNAYIWPVAESENCTLDTNNTKADTYYSMVLNEKGDKVADLRADCKAGCVDCGLVVTNDDFRECTAVNSKHTSQRQIQSYFVSSDKQACVGSTNITKEFEKATIIFADFTLDDSCSVVGAAHGAVVRGLSVNPAKSECYPDSNMPGTFMSIGVSDGVYTLSQGCPNMSCTECTTTLSGTAGTCGTYGSKILPSSFEFLTADMASCSFSPSKGKNDTPLVIGAIVGAIIIIAVIAGIAYFVMRRKRVAAYERINDPAF